jgi:hypothetical protein
LAMPEITKSDAHTSSSTVLGNAVQVSQGAR